MPYLATPMTTTAAPPGRLLPPPPPAAGRSAVSAVSGLPGRHQAPSARPRMAVAAGGAAVASVLVREVLAGPVRPAVVVAVGPSATYLDVGGRLVAVVAAGGMRLPCAVVLVGDGAPPSGRGLAVGESAVHQAGRRAVTVRRWFDPRLRQARLDAAAVAHLAAAVRARPCPDALLSTDAALGLADDLAGGDPRAAVDTLVGRGAGLTPAGDDLLAGALAALRAVGSPAAAALGAAVRALACGRTTRLSAALLAAADLGAVIPEAEAVLRALSTSAPSLRARADALGVPGRPPAFGRPVDALQGAVDRLLGVGHTSGWHLAAGLAAGAALALDHAPGPVSRERTR